MPGRQPFTHTSPPRNKPFAIGESGWHLPATGPSCSGEEALASLTGYYPHRRMDSILNPHTYKVAALRTEYARIKVASMRQSTSGLIRGFFEKCSAMNMSDEAILQAVYRAIDLHPALASEFKTIGVEKQAFGSFGGLPGSHNLLPKTATPAASGAAPGPAAPAPTPGATFRPPTPAPTPAAAGVGPGVASAGAGTHPPMSSPSRATLLTGHMPSPADAPAAPPAAHTDPFSLPAIPNPPNVRPDPAYPPGYRPPAQRSVLGQGLNNANNVLTGGVTSLGGGLGTLAGGLGSLGARATDGLGLTQGWTEGADKFTGNMMDAVHSGVATGYAGVTNQDPQLTAWNMRGKGYENAKPIDQMRQDHLRQLHDGGGVDMPLLGHISPETAGGTYNLLNNVSDTSARMAVAGQAAKGLPFGNVSQTGAMALPFFMGTGGEGLGSAVNTAFDAKNLGDIPSDFVTGMPSFQQGMTHPDQVISTGLDPESGEMIAKMRNGNRVPLSETSGPGGRGPAMLPDGRTPLPPSGIEAAPGYADIANLATQDPEQAQQLAGQAAGQLKGALGSKAGQTEVGNVMKRGTLSPQGMQQATVALTSQGYDTEKAMGIIKGMNGWEQLGLWGGLGLAGVGLLHAMSGGGGMASIIMALLGLGTAGFTAGKTGLLDQGSQHLTQGLTDAVMGQKPNPGMDAMLKTVKPMLPSMIENANPEMMAPVLRQLAAMSPDVANQLDQAAGVGSWGNSILGTLGGWTGMRQQKMQQMLGLNPAQQEKLLDLWRRARAQPR